MTRWATVPLAEDFEPLLLPVSTLASTDGQRVLLSQEKWTNCFSLCADHFSSGSVGIPDVRLSSCREPPQTWPRSSQGITYGAHRPFRLDGLGQFESAASHFFWSLGIIACAQTNLYDWVSGFGDYCFCLATKNLLVDGEIVNLKRRSALTFLTSFGMDVVLSMPELGFQRHGCRRRPAISLRAETCIMPATSSSRSVSALGAPG
jgi:hypothetical protein